MSSSREKKFDVAKKIDDYEVVKHLGSGGFGDIYAVIKDKYPFQKFAMKVEYESSDRKGLECEVKILQALGESIYFPKIIDPYRVNSRDKIRYFVMELLGPSLSSMRRICLEKKFSKYTVCILAKEMLKCIETVHERKFVHRDIKPGNFLIRNDPKNPVSIIDFGLAKCYIGKDGSHISDTRPGFVGTCRYASLNAHSGRELSRRDDLESWFYSVIELAHGRVPWPGSKDRAKTELMKRQLDHEKNQSTLISLDSEFIDIFQMIKKLGFKEKPPYKQIYEKIDEVLGKFGTTQSSGDSRVLDWFDNTKVRKDDLHSISMIAIEPPDSVRQEELESPSVNDQPKKGILNTCDCCMI